MISSIEQRTSWDIDYNRKLAQIAEKAGFDYALSQIRFAAGYGADKQHEPVSFSHALLAATEKLKVIAALLPGPWNPAVAAKQIATISQLTNARVSVNIVSGWFRGEFHAIGEPWFDHDERCRRSEEFINALRGIWTEESFTLNGDFYRFNEYSLAETARSAARGKPKRKPRTSCRKSSTRRSPMQFAASTTRSRKPATPAPRARGQLGQVHLPGSRSIQRRLPLEPDRHAAASR
ncbi:LLM class flavin-dependent oxidoreductase [Bradyrhizobium zhanjiangense]|uniref:LLM class flavin-dependent oxidoreductase n=1 Tax=Bradyrhizobium zhanjiangense TaxID=1325107 RepID=A0ABY0D8D1_9BRAD|nr:LLM class flavin-dependent oxidoreductase [Bradyrhizobium zhanjiangense]